MRVALIGAGPAGLTAAYQLAKAGVEVEVFEASAAVGGLAHSFKLWDQTVDFGPHPFYSSDARVSRLWLEIVGRDYQMVDRTTRIYYRGQLINDPLAAGNVLWSLGPCEAAGCLAGYVNQRCRGRAETSEASFEDRVVRRYGRRWFEIFFKTYSEKLWGIPCGSLDADVAANRIKELSLDEAVKNTLGLSCLRHGSPIDRFAYPNTGTGMVYDRMADYIHGLEGAVHLNSPVRRVLVERGRVRGLETTAGDVLRFDRIVSTLPLPLLVRNLEEAPPAVCQAAGSLTFRNMLLVYLRVAARELFPEQWLCVHSPELLTGRVTNFRNWVPQLCGDSTDTILAMEYWCSDDDDLWQQSDDDLVRRARAEITTTGLLRGAPVTAAHVGACDAAIRFTRAATSGTWT